MRNDPILRTATFDSKVIDYWLMSMVIICVLGVITIVLIPVLWVVLRPIFVRYLARVSCELHERSLVIRKGWLNRVEKTIPLDKITDLAMFQGPIMRAMNLKGFRVETAGSGGAASGYLVSMIGIVGTDDFRDAVLEQKDRIEESGRNTPRLPAEATADTSSDPERMILFEIRDLLKRIESHIQADRQARD